MYIKDKAELNAVVRYVRKELSNRGVELKYNTSHQMFARAHGHNTQASLLSTLPSTITLNIRMGESEESQVNEHYQIKSNLMGILKSIYEDNVKYNYLFAKIDILQTEPLPIIEPTYVDDLSCKSLIEWIQECIGDAYIVKGGVSLALRERHFEDGSHIFKGLNNQFNEAIETKSIISIAGEEKYNPFKNSYEDEVDGWYPDISVSSQVLLLKIETSSVKSEGCISIPESVLDQLRSESHKEWLNGLDDFTEFSNIFAGELSFTPLENINIYDFSQDTIQEDDFDNEEEYLQYLSQEPLTHLSSESELGQLCFEEDLSESIFSGLFSAPNYDYDNSQMSHLWVLEILKSRQIAGLPIPPIDIMLKNITFGGMYFSKDSINISVPHYDNFGAGAAEVATCAQHGKMLDIKKSFPEAQYFCVPNLISEEIYCPMSSQHCTPAILNHFGEAFRNWPSDVSKIQAKDKFAFEINGAALIEKYDIRSVCVDDFQESHGGMTGVLLASFYDERENMIAELSYCILQQNDFKISGGHCIELTFDKRLKSFCKNNNIEVLWFEHADLPKYGERVYNESNRTKGFIASTPESYGFDSTTLMGVRFPNLQRISSKLLNEAASSFFEWCVKDDDGQTVVFDYHSIKKSDDEINELKPVILDVIAARNNPLALTLIGSFFIGGFNLKGMAVNERYISIRNTLIRNTNYVETEGSLWFKLCDEVTKEWCDKLNIPYTPIEVSFFYDPFEIERNMSFSI